ncbi:hypothetical protein H9P43_000671 [Blastocladiella emersonii ATCC 22665]|nr:hypothetical protein H9P43_000671 [Blastocladiella emersonii ATCC 22665]
MYSPPGAMQQQQRQHDYQQQLPPPPPPQPPQQYILTLPARVGDDHHHHAQQQQQPFDSSDHYAAGAPYDQGHYAAHYDHSHHQQQQHPSYPPTSQLPLQGPIPNFGGGPGPMSPPIGGQSDAVHAYAMDPSQQQQSQGSALHYDSVGSGVTGDAGFYALPAPATTIAADQPPTPCVPEYPPTSVYPSDHSLVVSSEHPGHHPLHHAQLATATTNPFGSATDGAGPVYTLTSPTMAHHHHHHEQQQLLPHPHQPPPQLQDQMALSHSYSHPAAVPLMAAAAAAAESPSAASFSFPSHTSEMLVSGGAPSPFITATSTPLLAPNNASSSAADSAMPPPSSSTTTAPATKRTTRSSSNAAAAAATAAAAAASNPSAAAAAARPPPRKRRATKILSISVDPTPLSPTAPTPRSALLGSATHMGSDYGFGHDHDDDGFSEDDLDRHEPGSSASGAAGTSEPPTKKRRVRNRFRPNHNEVERNRRVLQRQRVLDLRDAVPSVRGATRASVTIVVTRAREYIHALEDRIAELDGALEAMHEPGTYVPRGLPQLPRDPITGDVPDPDGQTGGPASATADSFPLTSPTTADFAPATSGNAPNSRRRSGAPVVPSQHEPAPSSFESAAPADPPAPKRLRPRPSKTKAGASTAPAVSSSSNNNNAIAAVASAATAAALAASSFLPPPLQPTPTVPTFPRFPQQQHQQQDSMIGPPPGMAAADGTGLMSPTLSSHHESLAFQPFQSSAAVVGGAAAAYASHFGVGSTPPTPITATHFSHPGAGEPRPLDSGAVVEAGHGYYGEHHHHQQQYDQSNYAPPQQQFDPQQQQFDQQQQQQYQYADPHQQQQQADPPHGLPTPALSKNVAPEHHYVYLSNYGQDTSSSAHLLPPPPPPPPHTLPPVNMNGMGGPDPTGGSANLPLLAQPLVVDANGMVTSSPVVSNAGHSPDMHLAHGNMAFNDVMAAQQQQQQYHTPAHHHGMQPLENPILSPLQREYAAANGTNGGGGDAVQTTVVSSGASLPSLYSPGMYLANVNVGPVVPGQVAFSPEFQSYTSLPLLNASGSSRPYHRASTADQLALFPPPALANIPPGPQSAGLPRVPTWDAFASPPVHQVFGDSSATAAAAAAAMNVLPSVAAMAAMAGHAHELGADGAEIQPSPMLGELRARAQQHHDAVAATAPPPPQAPSNPSSTSSASPPTSAPSPQFGSAANAASAPPPSAPSSSSSQPPQEGDAAKEQAVVANLSAMLRKRRSVVDADFEAARAQFMTGRRDSVLATSSLARDGGSGQDAPTSAPSDAASASEPSNGAPADATAGAAVPPAN